MRKSVRGFQDKRAPETQLLRRQAQQQPLPPHQVQKLGPHHQRRRHWREIRRRPAEVQPDC